VEPFAKQEEEPVEFVCMLAASAEVALAGYKYRGCYCETARIQNRSAKMGKSYYGHGYAQY